MRVSCSVIFAVLLSVSALGQTVIRGHVIDKESKEPIAGVTVVSGNSYADRETTNREGYFQVKIDTTAGNLVISFVGYKTHTIHATSGVAEDLIVELEEDPQLVNLNLDAYNFSRDTLDLRNTNFAHAFAMTMKGVHLELPIGEFVQYLDSIATNNAVAKYRREDFLWGAAYLRDKSSKSGTVTLTRAFIKRAGITAVENFSVMMIERG